MITSPIRSQVFSFENLSSPQLLALMLEAARTLNWYIGRASEHGFIAYVKQSGNSPGCELKVVILGKEVIVESRSTGFRMSNGDLNQQKIDQLFAASMELKQRISPHELALEYEEIRERLMPPETSFLSQPPSTLIEDFPVFAGIFKTREGYYATPVLIDLNMLIFLVIFLSGVNMMHPDMASLIRWGAD
jgi:rhomboid protease GluP